MNSFEIITLTEVRDNIKARMRGLSTTIDDMYIDFYILQAHRRLLGVTTFINKDAIVDICDNKMELPCDYYDMIALLPYPCVPNQGQLPMLYTDVLIDGAATCRYSGFNKLFSVEQGYLLFPSSFEGYQAQIFYRAYHLGEDGYPILRKNYEEYYVCAVMKNIAQMDNNISLANYWNAEMKKFKFNQVNNDNVEQYRLAKETIRTIIYSIQ